MQARLLVINRFNQTGKEGCLEHDVVSKAALT
jgi:hypothetical protein